MVEQLNEKNESDAIKALMGLMVDLKRQLDDPKKKYTEKQRLDLAIAMQRAEVIIFRAGWEQFIDDNPNWKRLKSCR